MPKLKYFIIKMKNRIIYIFICVFLVILNVCLAEIHLERSILEKTRPIRVGILRSHPLKTPITEKFVVRTILMAINEINNEDGVLKRKVVSTIIKSPCNQKIIAREIEEKINEEKLSVIFCSGNSYLCEFVAPICEEYNIPIFCTCKSQGFKKSKNVIFTGTMPNQKINPAIKWCSDNFGKKYFLVGSNTTFSKIHNLIIKDNVNALGGEIVGEVCIPEGSGDFNETMRKIIETGPDVILNTISGESNVYFFINLYVKKIKSDKIPVISFDITANDFKNMSFNEAAGNYIVKSYFQEIASKENNKFLRKIEEKYGKNQIIEDSVESGYFGVYLWKQAVEDAETDNIKDVELFLNAQNFDAPGGMVCIDTGNQNTWKIMRIGKVGKKKQINIIWCSDELINPESYLLPNDKSKQGQSNTLATLHKNKKKR